MRSKILLVNIDSLIPNLALLKIGMYYKRLGYRITTNPIDDWDKAFVSCVFAVNKHKCKFWEGMDDVEIGGSGYSLTTKLPPKIEKIKPHANIGFTLRGCPRKCDFCIVPIKEGKPEITNSLYDIWDGKAKKVILIDNNILSVPKHFKHVANQAIKKNIIIDWNQGLDFRLLTDEICDYLRRVPHEYYRFSFDKSAYTKGVKRAIKLLDKHGLKNNMWYVLVGFDTTYQEDLDRLLLLKSHGQHAYVQRYNSKTNKFYTTLAAWANQHGLFKYYNFWDFAKGRHVKPDIIRKWKKNLQITEPTDKKIRSSKKELWIPGGRNSEYHDH